MCQVGDRMNQTRRGWLRVELLGHVRSLAEDPDVVLSRDELLDRLAQEMCPDGGSGPAASRRNNG
jgi:hypothetical protein